MASSQMDAHDSLAPFILGNLQAPHALDQDHGMHNGSVLGIWIHRKLACRSKVRLSASGCLLPKSGGKFLKARLGGGLMKLRGSKAFLNMLNKLH